MRLQRWSIATILPLVVLGIFLSKKDIGRDGGPNPSRAQAPAKEDQLPLNNQMPRTEGSIEGRAEKYLYERRGKIPEEGTQASQVEDELETTGEINGIIKQHNHEGFPEVSLVAMYPYISVESGSKSASEGTPDMFAGMRWTRSDTKGLFKFDSIPCGEYSVLVAPHALLDKTEDKVLVTSGGVTEVAITLPELGKVGGRIVVPNGISMKGLYVSAMRDEKPGDLSPEEQILRQLRLPIAAVDSLGRYEVQYLPYGEYRIDLLLFPNLDDMSDHEQDRRVSPRAVANGNGLPRLEIGKSIVDGDEVMEDYALKNRAPGSLKVVAKAKTEHSSELIVIATDKYGNRIEGTLDDEDRWQADAMFGGEWEISIALPVVGRLPGSTKAVVVVPGKSTTLEVNAAVYRWTLHVRNEKDSQPAKGVRVTISFPSGSGWSLPTDDRGRVTVELPVGRYRVLVGGGQEEAKWKEVSIDWRADGVVPEVINIGRE